MIQRIDIVIVALAQVGAEGILALVAVAFTAVLVGNMPRHHRRVLAVALGQQRVHLLHLFPVDGRSVAMVVPLTKAMALAVFVDTKHLGVLFRHPAGTGTAGGRQHHSAAGGIDLVENGIQKREVILPFPGLQHGPGENADGHLIAVGLLHQAHIRIPDLRCSDPLLWIIVRAVEKMGIFFIDVLSCHGDALHRYFLLL